MNDDFLTAFAAAGEIDIDDAAEHWAGFSRQLSDSEIAEYESGGAGLVWEGLTMNNTTYTVEQTFEGIGDSSRETFDNLADAEKYAHNLRKSIVAQVRELDYEPAPRTGWEHEVEAWKHAFHLTNGRRKFTRRAGQHIACAAVKISEEAVP
jgi:hypothetical protein